MTNPRSATRPWLAAGALGRLRWDLNGWLGVEAQGTIRLPIIRDRFYFEPSTTVYDVPAIAGAASLGLGARFL